MWQNGGWILTVFSLKSFHHEQSQKIKQTKCYKLAKLSAKKIHDA